MGLLARDPRTNAPVGNPDPVDVPRFLNRVLSLPVAEQNKAFGQFIDLFARAITRAKEQGSFDEGVEDLKHAQAIRLDKADLVHRAEDGAETWHYQLSVDEKTHPLSYEGAQQTRQIRDQAGTPHGGKPSGFYKQARSGNIVMASQAGTGSDAASGTTWRNYVLFRPGGNEEYVRESDFNDKYVPVSEAEARAWWNAKYADVPKVRTRELHLIGGAMLQFWSHLRAAGAQGMHVVRAQAEGGQRVVGLEIPNAAVATVLKALGVERELTDPGQIFNALAQGGEFDLAAGMKLRATKVHREDAYELVGAKLADFPTVRGMGLIEESIEGKKRFFVPTDPAKGLPILEKILKQWPALSSGTGDALHSLRRESDTPIWYSQLERTIEQKMPAKGSVPQILGIIDNPQSGVKPDEIKWTGLRDFLVQQKGAVSKQDVLDYLAQNAVQVREVEAGDKFKSYTLSGEKPDYNELLFTLSAKQPDPGAWDRTMAEQLSRLQHNLSAKYGSEVRYNDPRFTLEERAKYDAAVGMLDRSTPPSQYDLTVSEWWHWATPEEKRAALESLPQRQATKYTSPHWNEPNVVAHARFDTRTNAKGEKVLLVEEIQSDWHQAGREKGYQPTGAERAALDEQLEASERGASYWSTKRADYMQEMKGMLPEQLEGKMPSPKMGTPEWQTLVDRITSAERNANEFIKQSDAIRKQRSAGVPSAPFSKTWHEMVFRRMLRYAAENGYDRVAWTTGAQQVARYDLSKHVSKIAWTPPVSPEEYDALGDVLNAAWLEHGNMHGTLEAQRDAQNRVHALETRYAISGKGVGILEAWNKKGERVVRQDIAPTDLVEHVGKDAAQRLLAQPQDASGAHTLEGKSLQVGGHGMGGFYDEILPQYAAKYGKKWGAKVEDAKIGGSPKDPEMQAKLAEIDARYADQKNAAQAAVTDKQAALDKAEADVAERRKALESQDKSIKEGEIIATVGSAGSVGGYPYSTGKLLQATRTKGGSLIWKNVGTFGGTRSGRSDKYVRELKQEAAIKGYRWIDYAAHNNGVTNAGAPFIDMSERARAQKELDEAKWVLAWVDRAVREAKAAIKPNAGKVQTVHSIDITPSMRESVMQGQPLFAMRARQAAFAEANAQGWLRHGVVYLNPAGAAFLASLEEKPRPWVGVAMPAPAVYRMRAKISKMMAQTARASLSEDFTALNDLQSVLGEAQEKESTVIMIEVGPPDTYATVKARVRHEKMHREQLKMGGVSSHVDWDEFLSHPVAQIAARALMGDGYPADEPILAAEMGAHLASGPIGWRQMNLTDQQAFDLYRAYVDNLNAATPAAVNAHLKHVHPLLRTIKYGQPHPGVNASSQAGPGSLPARILASVSKRAPDTGDLFGADESNAEAEAAGAAKLNADQLTAEFNSPTRGKTKRSKVTKQQGLFEETPEEEQQSLFMLREAAQNIVETQDDVRRVFAPQARAQAAPAASELRFRASESAHEYAQAEHALEEARAYFAPRPFAENLDFINRIEDGLPQPNDELQKIADVMRELLDTQRKAVQALGSGKLQTFYETYFPHLWKRPQEAVDAFKLIFARRPLEGTKSFLKQRTFHSFQEGIDAGLEPVSENPVDLVLAKLKEMGRYLLAHRWLNEMKRQGMARYVPARELKRAPKGWTQLPDPIGTVYGNPRVPVREALDKEMLAGMQKLLDNLGVDHKRLVQMKGTRWGYAVGDSKIRTRFGGTESILIHEIGHILDERYGLAAQLVNTSPYREELRDLADERMDDPTQKNGYKRYVRNKHEKIANLVAAYIHNRRRFQAIAPKTFQFFKAFIDSHPELAELGKLEYGMKLTVLRNELDTGGLLIRGYWYMPEGAVQVAKNFLSPGLARYSAYRGLRTYANATLQFALGFSGYHAGFTAGEAMVSRLGTAIQAAAAGQGALAISNALKIPVSLATNVALGSKIIQEYLAPTGADPEIAKYAAALVEGGGRVKMDEQYRTHLRQKFHDAWVQADAAGKLFTVAGHPLRNVGAIAELAAWPVMEWLVPRQKVGAFAVMAEQILDAHKDASPQEIRRLLAQAWDSIDNRFGQLVYDNLFWNRIAKDLAMISVQSVGWNMGTFREILGGFKDTAKFGIQSGRYIGGKIRRAGGGGGSGSGGPGGDEGGGGGTTPIPPEFTPRMAYIIALPLLMGFIGAIVTYLTTGAPPKDWRDYYAPPTDASRKKRIFLASYMKDVIHWGEHPLQAAVGKIHPWLRTTAETAINRDWQGRQIYNPKDPLYLEALAAAEHQLGSFDPYAWRNFWRARLNGDSAWMQAAPFVGITQAPQYMSQSRAEERMSELAGSHREGVGEDPTAVARSHARTELTQLVREHSPQAAARAEAELNSGRLTVADLKRALADGAMSAPAARFKRLGTEEALEVYHLGTPAERSEWLPELAHKIVDLNKRSPEEFGVIQRRWRPELAEALHDAGAQ